MDWYLGSNLEDFVVPEGQEVLDRLPSPDSWLQWGLDSEKSFDYPNKYSYANLSRGDNNLDADCFCDEVDMETSFGDEEEFYIGATTFSQDWPDYEFNDLAGIDQTDDIFLSSLLEDTPGSISRNLHKPFFMSPESQVGVKPADNLVKEMALDPQNILSDEHSIRNSEYLNKHVYCPSVSLDSPQSISTNMFSPFIPKQNDYPQLKALAVKGQACPKNKKDGNVDEVTLLQESVLQELGMMIEQFTETTRVSFRDSFYRLANNSRYQHIVTQSQNGDPFIGKPPSQTACDEKMSFGRKSSTESNTNKIDRAISNLMFNKMEANVQDTPSPALAKFKQEVTQNYNSNYPKNGYNLGNGTLQGDAVVPVHIQRF